MPQEPATTSRPRRAEAGDAEPWRLRRSSRWPWPGRAWSGGGTSLRGLPDIGEPFDRAKYGTFDVPEADNAWTYYREATARLTPSPKAPWARGRPWSQLPDEAREWTHANREALAIWYTGTTKERSAYIQPRDLRIDTRLDVAQNLRTVSSLANYTALEREDAGDFEGAWKWHGAALRASRHCGTHGTIIERLVGMAMYNNTASLVRAWSDNPKVPAETLRHALDDLIAINALTPRFGDWVRSEYFAMASMVDDPDLSARSIRRVLANASYSNGPEERPGPAERLSEAVWRVGLREPERSRRVFRLLYANWLSVGDLTDHERAKRRRTIGDRIYFDPPPDAPASAPIAGPGRARSMVAVDAIPPRAPGHARAVREGVRSRGRSPGFAGRPTGLAPLRSRARRGAALGRGARRPLSESDPARLRPARADQARAGRGPAMSLPKADEWNDPGSMDDPPRPRRARRIVATMALAIAAIVGSSLLWWSTSLRRLPDLGPPFDLELHGTASIPEAENAFTDYRAAVSALVGERPSSLFRPDISWPQLTQDERDWFFANSDAIERWLAGTAKDRAIHVQPKDLRLDTDLHVVHGLRTLNTLARIAGSRVETQGDPDEAWYWYRAGLRASRQSGRDGTIIERLVGIALYSELASSIRAWADLPSLSRTAIRQALDDLIAINADDPTLGEVLRAEYFLTRALIDDPDLTIWRIDHELSGLPDPTGPGFRGRWSERLAKLFKREPERSRRAMNLIFANWLSVTGLAEAERDRRGHIVSDPSVFDWPAEAGPASRIPPDEIADWVRSTLLLRRILSNLSGFEKAERRESALRAALVVELAERLYARDHGKPPDAPEELVGPYLSAMPEGYKPAPSRPNDTPP